MNIRTLGRALGAFALLAAGCGDDTTGQDSGTAPDMTVVAMPDMTALPDMTLPPDMTPPPVLLHPTILVEELATNVAVGGMAVPAKFFSTVVINGDPAKSKKSDYDMTDNLGLGCSANHYMVGGGDDPTPDTTLGTVTFTGMTTGAALNTMMIPAEINCALGATGFYACGYGPLVNGMSNPMTDVNAVPFPGATEMAKAGTVINVKYAGGGMAGTFDSAMKLASTDPLAVSDDLTKIKYDAASDTIIHFSCVNKPMNCFDAVLVQIVASSVAPGMAGFPGADNGSINCAGLANGGEIKIPKEAIAAMYGGSANIKYVMTRVVRGALPPAGTVDSKGNPVRLALGRGVMAFAPR